MAPARAPCKHPDASIMCIRRQNPRPRPDLTGWFVGVNGIGLAAAGKARSRMCRACTSCAQRAQRGQRRMRSSAQAAVCDFRSSCRNGHARCKLVPRSAAGGVAQHVRRVLPWSAVVTLFSSKGIDVWGDGPALLLGDTSELKLFAHPYSFAVGR